MEKYYTPTVEEFHVGFEIECLTEKGDWHKEVFEDYMYNLNLTLSSYEKFKHKVRVKCLDRQDLESLGWEFVPDDSVGDGNMRWYDLFRMNEFTISLGLGKNIIHRDAVPSPSMVFEGKIKNKSELIKLMKMIEIKKS